MTFTPAESPSDTLQTVDKKALKEAVKEVEEAGGWCGGERVLMVVGGWTRRRL